MLVLSFSNLDSDPRVERHLLALGEADARVSTCGLRPPAVPVERHFNLDAPRRTTAQRAMALLQLLSRRYDAYYWGDPMAREAERLLAPEHFDGIVANDMATLPLALRLARGAPVLIDAHEFSPDEFGDRAAWRFLYSAYADFLCRTYLPRAAAAVTVSPGIARAYAERYPVHMQVLTNAACLTRPPAPRYGEGIRMIHHGAAIRSRRLEYMIEVLERLDERFTLDLMLVPRSAGYIDQLRRRAAGNPRVAFRPPVPTARIVETCAAYDVGLCFFPPVNRSLEFCLPNKFFEFVHAGLAVATGPSPDMARIVREFGCGVVADDFRPESLARALSTLSAESLARMKSGARSAAQVHNAGANGEKLRGLIAAMLAKAA